jgi:hypothetical protein
MTITKKINSYEELINDLYLNNITMVHPNIMKTILTLYPQISLIEGDILECGVWRGGVSIFLSYLFNDRNIWVSDSFQGFQPLEMARYKYLNERHTPAYTHCANGPMGISLEEVKFNFEKYGLQNNSRITFLKGFVKDTLPSANIEKLALLRIDVDSFSATLEVLDEMYNKVQPGGCIIFDDSNLTESLDAIKTFFTKYNIDYYILHPITHDKLYLNSKYTFDDSGFPTGCYIIKK